MKSIEVEVRSFITEEEYRALMSRLKTEARLVSEDEQVTYYFDSEQDLRIQKNSEYSKVWLKKGQMHDDHREEIEIRHHVDDFDSLERLFFALGYNIQIKWFRHRTTFRWDDVEVMLDHTKGYGYIIELEKMSDEDGIQETLVSLKERLATLGIAPTPKEVFAERYAYYKEHWRELVVQER